MARKYKKLEYGEQPKKTLGIKTHLLDKIHEKYGSTIEYLRNGLFVAFSSLFESEEQYNQFVLDYPLTAALLEEMVN